jgi:hypothetical protein
MLQQVRKAGHRPESRRHYGHNESRTRNEPSARAQYQISHGTAAEWDKDQQLLDGAKVRFKFPES